MVDRFHSLWLLAHHQHGLSQLALRGPGLHRRLFLRLDVAQDRLDLRLRPAPRRRRYHLALPLSNGLNWPVFFMKRRTDSRIQSGNEARGRPSARLARSGNAKHIQEESDGGSDDTGSSSVPVAERVHGTVEE